MKTVTIPTCANPFVVFVNGIKYTYPAGATVEVPDDVAAVIEQHDEAHSKPAPAPVVPPFVPSANNVIDLTKYTAGEGLSFNDKLFQLFATGEDYDNLDDDCSIWVDIEKCQNPVIVVDMSAMMEGVKFYCNPTFVAKEHGRISELNMAFTAPYDANTNMKVTFVIGAVFDTNTNEPRYSYMRLVTEVM